MLKATAERGRLIERDRDREKDRMTNLKAFLHTLMNFLNKLKPDKHLCAYFTQKQEAAYLICFLFQT